MSGSGNEATALLADIGGTNARFALLSADGTSPLVRLKVAEHAQSYDALGAALETLSGRAQRPLTAAVLAFAGPVSDERAQMTNSGWDARSDELCRRFGFRSVRLMNDYAALALGLDRLTEDDRLTVGPPLSSSGGALAVIGPGSGLGVAALMPAEAQPQVLVGEGGHSTMAATNDVEAQVLAFLRARYGHVSAERLLSGPGLTNIHQALSNLEGAAVEAMDPAEVTQLGLEGSDDRCRRSLQVFCAFLGSFAGSMALCYGAQGGVYLGGGILPRFPEFLAESDFRRRFEDKGRLSGYLARIPTWLITQPDAAFAGLTVAARQLLGAPDLISADMR
ncbi:glucokinase [Pelagibius sp.]|uniref:glucokinase n=1 Tax=Pelagibius sp. TaxID=1931238 RepID=UPI00260FD892|nr:glucokinase [Pelagibius sp.]